MDSIDKYIYIINKQKVTYYLYSWEETVTFFKTLKTQDMSCFIQIVSSDFCINNFSNLPDIIDNENISSNEDNSNPWNCMCNSCIKKIYLCDSKTIRNFTIGDSLPIYGYKEIVLRIKLILQDVIFQKDENEKIRLSRKLFRILLANKWFLEKYDNFRKIVHKKLFEFMYHHHNTASSILGNNFSYRNLQ